MIGNGRKGARALPVSGNGVNMSTLMIDARCVSTGIGTYTINIVRDMNKYNDLKLRLITAPQGKPLLERLCDDIITVNAPMYSLREQFEIPWAARNCNVLHVPHYNVPLAYSKCLLVTIHDLNHILDHSYRRTAKSWLYAQPMLRWAALRADHIFTLSQYSKRQIMEHLGADEKKITVVYCGVSAHLFPEPREQARLEINHDFAFDGPYVLFVGNLKPNKNVAGLLNAFAKTCARHALPHKLLIIGDDAVGRPAMLKLSLELGLEGTTVFVSRVTDDQLRSAYSGADMTVLPSFEEGFGLPVLESMACGTPVACSNGASLPEVGGQAAEYFDPKDQDSICEALERVLLSNDLRAEMRSRGLQQARRFTWQACSELHHDIYRKFLMKSAFSN